MKLLLDWAGVHYFFAFISILTAGSVLLAPFKIANRVIRHFNIRARGWPPAHLDADGDFKKEEE